MYDVKGHLHEVLDTLPEGVCLVAISKFHPNEYIEAAYAEGQRVFGESHEQELRYRPSSAAASSQTSLCTLNVGTMSAISDGSKP